MKTFKVSSTVGNFEYTATIEATDSVEAALLMQGALRVLQGKVSGEWEKSIAYPGKGVKRPEKFNRKSIPFSKENADALARIYKGAEVEVGRNEKDEAIVEDLGVTEITVSEYTGAEAAVPKFKAEKDFVNLYLTSGAKPGFLADGRPRTVETFAESRGITPPTEPWEEDTEFLAAVKAWDQARKAAEAAGE